MSLRYLEELKALIDALLQSQTDSEFVEYVHVQHQEWINKMLPILDLELSNKSVHTIFTILIPLLTQDGVYDTRSRAFLFDFVDSVSHATSKRELIEIELKAFEEMADQLSNVDQNSASASTSEVSLNSGSESLESVSESSLQNDSINGIVTPLNAAQVSTEKEAVNVKSMSEHSQKTRLKKHSERNARKNKWALSLAGISGAIILGVTGGLAAPLVGAGLAGLLSGLGIVGTGAFLTASGGVALLTSLFGLTGAGLSTYSMRNRMKGIKEFFFYSHHLSPPQTSSKNQMALGKLLEQQKQYTHRNCHLPTVTLTVSGWINKLENVVLPWHNPELFDGTDHYSVCFDLDELMGLANAVERFVTSQTLTMSVVQGLKYTLLSGLMSTMALPASVLSLTYVLDNPWIIAYRRAEKAGAVLAEVLVERVQGHRPVSLFGTSLGAFCIFSALEKLASLKSPPMGLIFNVVLLGCPVSNSSALFTKIRLLIANRFINVYMKNDLTLSLFTRTAFGNLNGGGLAGLEPVNLIGIENYDATGIIKGHSGYNNEEELASFLSTIL